MKPALENRIREAIRDSMAKDSSLFSAAVWLNYGLGLVSLDVGCTPAQARAVWDKHFAITEAN